MKVNSIKPYLYGFGGWNSKPFLLDTGIAPKTKDGTRSDEEEEDEEECKIWGFWITWSESQCVQRNQAQRVQSAHSDSAEDHAPHPFWLRRRCHGSHGLWQNGSVSCPHASPPQPAYPSVWCQSPHSIPYQGLGPSDSQVHQRAWPLHRSTFNSTFFFFHFLFLWFHFILFCFFSFSFDQTFVLVC